MAVATAAVGTRETGPVTDDAKIVRGLRHREAGALEALSSAYGRLIRHWARSEGPDADDVVQEVLFGVWRAGPRLRPDTTLPALLRTITRNAVRNRWRSRERKPSTPVGLEPNVIDATDPIGARTERIAAEQVLDGLADRERECLRLLYFADLSIADVASRLGATPAATKSLAARARRRLRAELGTVR